MKRLAASLWLSLAMLCAMNFNARASYTCNFVPGGFTTPPPPIPGPCDLTPDGKKAAIRRRRRRRRRIIQPRA